MENAKREGRTFQYTIVVEGPLDSLWEHWFEGMKIALTDQGVTVLSGEVVDQSALLGLLEKIHDLNLTLLSVQKMDPEQSGNTIKRSLPQSGG